TDGKATRNRLPAYIQHDQGGNVVEEVLADARQVEDGGDANAPEHLARADSGPVEDLWRVVSARREDDPAPLYHLAARQTDSDCAPVSDDQRVDQRVCADREIVSRAGVGDVGQQRALPLSVPHVPGQRA